MGKRGRVGSKLSESLATVKMVGWIGWLAAEGKCKPGGKAFLQNLLCLVGDECM